MFVPTATMANQIALKLHSRPGDVLLAEETSHVLVYEYGGAAAHAGLMSLGLTGANGRVTAGADPRRGGSEHEDRRPARSGALAREHPQQRRGEGLAARRAGGLSSRPRASSGSRVHLDGARLLNAATALGVAPATFTSRFDTVTLCLSKGLGCPLGALLAGSSELIERAWREKHLFGGAMRQAGIVAAAGVYALDHHVERLADDHARARRLAESLAEAGIAIDLERVETNFVQIDLAPLGLDRTAALSALREAGVGLSATIHPTVVRAVTHLEITDEDIDRAAELIPQSSGSRRARRSRLADDESGARQPASPGTRAAASMPFGALSDRRR